MAARNILTVVSSMVALFMSLKYQAPNIDTSTSLLNFYPVPSHQIDSILLCNKVSNSSLRESDDILFSHIIIKQRKAYLHIKGRDHH